MRLREGESGQTIVLLALASLFFISLLAVVAETSLVYIQRRELQNTADAAALAGVQSLQFSQAQAEADAIEWAQKNIGDLATINVTFPDADTIRVEVTKQSATLFGGTLSFGEPEVTARAAAALHYEPERYTLMALDDSACAALNVRGQASVTITEGGRTYTSSDCASALRVEGQATLSSGGNDLVDGGAQVSGGATLTPGATTGVDSWTDPLAHLTPAYASCPTYQGDLIISSSTPTTLDPGHYCRRVRVEGNANVTLGSGFFHFHRGLEVTGGGDVSFVSDGPVVLFGTCQASPCDGATPADFIFQGDAGNISLEGDPAFDNVVIWMDQTAGPGSKVRLAGCRVQGINGVIYAANSEVEMEGCGTTTLSLNMAIIAGTIDIAGNHPLTIPYNVDFAPRRVTLSLVE